MVRAREAAVAFVLGLAAAPCAVAVTYTLASTGLPPFNQGGFAFTEASSPARATSGAS